MAKRLDVAGIFAEVERDRISFERGVRQAIEWLRADYEYGSGPDWREHGSEWIAERLAEWRIKTYGVQSSADVRTPETER